VTGAAGFIASRVCQALLDSGHEVVGVDNLSDAYDVRLKEWRLERLRPQERFQFHPVDICRKEDLEPLFAPQLDAVINLAARAGVRQSVENPWVYIETNVTGTLNLLELCKETGVGKFVLASTSSLYGVHNPQPFKEDADTSQPLSPYAASKKGAEALCYSYHHLCGIDVTIFRYFTVYGPAGRPDMSLFRFVQWVSEGREVTVFGDGKQTRDFTYVEDVARGTILGLKPLGYDIINLGSDKPWVLMDVLHLVEELVGREAKVKFEPRHPADVVETWADIGRAKDLLGWEPGYDFRAGVKSLVDWYAENRSWAREIKTS